MSHVRTNRPRGRILDQRGYADGVLAVGRAMARGPLDHDAASGVGVYRCAQCTLGAEDLWDGDAEAARLGFAHWDACPVILARALGFDR